MALSCGRTLRCSRVNAGAHHTRRSVVCSAAAAPAKKGFGKVPAGPMKDGCPCGSNKVYKVCCKKFHNGTIAPTLEETVRARYCAVIKKDVDYLMSTYHKEFTTVFFSGDTAPGEHWDKLRDETQKTVDYYEYSNFKILKIEEGEQPGEMYAALQYQVLDKRTPSLDANSKKKIKRLQTEHGRYLRDEDGRWKLVDFRRSDIPADIVKAAQLETPDLAEQAEQRKAAAAAAEASE